jgi:hypothetical protein
MQCSDYEVLISNAVDGELSADEQVRLDTHVASCDSCREELDAFRAMQEDLGMVEPPELPAGLQQAIRREIAPNPHGFGRRITAVAAALLILVVAAVVMTLPEEAVGPQPGPAFTGQLAFEHPDSDRFAFSDVVGLPGGDLVAVGNGMDAANAADDLHLVRIAPDGSVRWSKQYSTDYSDAVRTAISAPNGDLILGGMAGRIPGRDYDALIVRLDGDGKLLWQKTVGGAWYDRCFDVAVDSTGAVYAAISTAVPSGWSPTMVTDSAGGHGAVWLVKFSPDGDLVWETRFDPVRLQRNLSLPNSIPQVLVDPDGSGYLLATSNLYSGQATNAWLTRFDVDGQPVWQRVFLSDRELQPMMLERFDNGTVAVAGTNGLFKGGVADPFMICVGPNGEQVWSRELVTEGLTGIGRAVPVKGRMAVWLRSYAQQDRTRTMIGTFGPEGDWIQGNPVVTRGPHMQGAFRYVDGIGYLLTGMIAHQADRVADGWLQWLGPDLGELAEGRLESRELAIQTVAIDVPILHAPVRVEDHPLVASESGIQRLKSDSK